jgi:hypothetical protein
MATRSKLFMAVGIIGLLVVLLAVYQSLVSCVLSEAQAKEMVLIELAQSGFHAKFLRGPTQAPGTCSYDFHYEGNGQKVDYVVIEDPPRGPAVTWWDYAADKNGP